jgi:hypothetical protein
MSSALLNYTGGVFEFVNSGGVSQEAIRVSDLFKHSREQLRSQISLGSAREECRDQLLDVWSQAAVDGWDGYEGRPAQRNAVANAYKLIDAFPSNLPMPEVSVDPDGEISFDWFGAPRRQFSISISSDNVLSYAGLFGSAKVSGSEQFEGGMPPILLYHIKRAMQRG